LREQQAQAYGVRGYIKHTQRKSSEQRTRARCVRVAHTDALLLHHHSPAVRDLHAKHTFHHTRRLITTQTTQQPACLPQKKTHLVCVLLGNRSENSLLTNRKLLDQVKIRF
jgi:hypothetical protein